MARTLTRKAVGYDDDFHAWLMEQAAHARARRTDALDLDNIAEELESLGRSDRRAVRNRLITMLEHLVKLAFSPDFEPRRGWARTLVIQRERLGDILRDSPSLASLPAEIVEDCYRQALRRVIVDGRLDAAGLPQACPFSVEQALDPDYLPEPPAPA